MRLSRMLLPLLLCAGPVACSIKEDRTDCPCALELTVVGGEFDRSVLSVWEDGLRMRDTLQGGSGVTSFVVDIPKGNPTLSIASGQFKADTRGTGISIPLGEEMDEIYAWSAEVDSRREELEVRATLHKQYAYIHLNVIFQNGEDSPYVLRIKSNVCGMDLTTLRPVEGPFEVSFLPVVGKYHRICVPRQMDSSMTLEFVPRDIAGEIETLPIGNYLEKSGYDWSSEDLSDIYMDIDNVRAGISVRVENWKEGTTVNLVI